MLLYVSSWFGYFFIFFYFYCCCFVFLFLFRCLSAGWFSKAPGLSPLAWSSADAQRNNTNSFAFSQRMSFSKRKGNLSFLEFVNKTLGETEELCLHFRSDLLRNSCEHQYIGEMYSRTFHPCENIILLQPPRSLRPRVICWSQKLKMPSGYCN